MAVKRSAIEEAQKYFVEHEFLIQVPLWEKKSLQCPGSLRTMKLVRLAKYWLNKNDTLFKIKKEWLKANIC